MICKGAALRVVRRARPLTNPHPRDASGGADCVRVKFIIALRFFKILSLILKFLAAKIVKF